MDAIQSAAVSAAEEEFRLRSFFGKDRGRLETTLVKSQILIDRAERWSFKDPRLAQLLTQLKDAAYDAEDVLDDIDYQDQQKKIQAQQSQASQLFQNSLNYLRNLINGAGKKMRTIHGRLDTTAADLEGLMGQLGLHGDYRMPANRQMGSLANEPTVYGRDEEREKVIKLLGVPRGQSNNENDSASVSAPAKRRKKETVSVLAIYGIGGVGKTTLAQVVYNDERVVNHFDKKIWICVSDNFNVESLSKEIIHNASKGYNTDGMNLGSLQQSLKEIVMAHRFLLILDDVWSEDSGEWQKFYAPLSFGKEGSMILVTTRTLKVANIAGTMDPIFLEGLSGNVYREFFKSCAFRRENPEDYPELENIGIEIAAKLKGSPLAAKTLGGLLNEDMSAEHWTTILNSELWELQQQEGDIIPALRLSYLYLLPHLKRCFSFCSIFPKDYEFDKSDLTNIWVAEGFVIPQGNMLLEDIATMYLHDLTIRCFFQQSHKYPLKCVMHDLIHDLAQFVSADECSRIEKGREQIRISKTVRHLSICNQFLGKQRLMELVSYNKLRSIIQIPNYMYGLYYVTDCWFHEFANIRCLKLSSVDIKNLPESISNLKHLRYLDVSWACIQYLPKSFCHLNNLQVLKIQNYSFNSFPRGFSRLHNLRKLYAEEKIISKISEIGKLTSLQYLPLFKVRKDDQHKIRELKHMTQLRGCLHIKKLENVESKEDACQAELDNKPHLDELILEWSERESNFHHDTEVLEGLQPHKNLKKLKISHYGGTTSPSWLRYLPSLEAFTVQKCKKLTLHLPDSFKDFVSLKSMYIKDCPHLTSLPEEVMCQLKSLESLYIVECEELSSLGGLGALASLKDITIQRCPKLADSEPPMFDFTDEVQRAEIDLLIDRTTLLKVQSLRNLVPFIRRLTIEQSTEPEMFVGEDGELLRRFKSLKYLRFKSCCELNSLPTELHRLTSLQKLSINWCLKIHPLPENGLPASLTKLDFSGCNDEFRRQLETYKSQKILNQEFHGFSAGEEEEEDR